MCKKYEKYDVDKHKDKDPNVVSGGDDAFASLYGVVEADTDAASQVCLCLCLCLCVHGGRGWWKGSFLVCLKNVFLLCSDCWEKNWSERKRK